MELAELAIAYTRRLQFESKILAGELAYILTQSMGGLTAVNGWRANTPPARRVHADVLLGEMGIKISEL